jgi:hypothetical protein
VGAPLGLGGSSGEHPVSLAMRDAGADPPRQRQPNFAGFCAGVEP